MELSNSTLLAIRSVDVALQSGVLREVPVGHPRTSTDCRAIIQQQTDGNILLHLSAFLHHCMFFIEYYFGFEVANL